MANRCMCGCDEVCLITHSFIGLMGLFIMVGSCLCAMSAI